jgi:hypothetical protein
MPSFAIREIKMKKRYNSGLYRSVVGLVLLVFLLGMSAVMAEGAAKPEEMGKTEEMAITEEMGRFEVVAGSGDMAYLVDTATGAVWVLTYRTMATGREPIAIPYKFILRTPKEQGEFLLESPGTSISLPPSAGK